jgi:hypothetical protein
VLRVQVEFTRNKKNLFPAMRIRFHSFPIFIHLGSANDDLGCSYNLEDYEGGQGGNTSQIDGAEQRSARSRTNSCQVLDRLSTKIACTKESIRKEQTARDGEYKQPNPSANLISILMIVSHSRQCEWIFEIGGQRRQTTTPKNQSCFRKEKPKKCAQYFTITEKTGVV